MIRVLQSVNKMDRGGIETLLMTIFRNIDREKIIFDFLVTDNGVYDEEIIKLGGKIHKIEGRRDGVWKYNKNLNNFFRENNYLIVHHHVSSLTNIEPLKVATKFNVPTRIIHIHNTAGPKGLLHYASHLYNKFLINRYATAKFSCSNDATIWGFGNKALKNNEVILFKNGIETKNFLFNEDIRLKTRKKLGLKNKFVVGHVGRFSTQKNHKFIIEIFEEIKKRESDSVLLLIGVGKLENEIKAKVKEKELEDSVKFLGSRSDINELMQAMDAFLFPSLHEGLGIVAIEAQAASLPVFASKEVPIEANISDLFNYIKLESDASDWAEILLRRSKANKRIDREKEININGYNIQKNAEWLSNYYLKIVSI